MPDTSPEKRTVVMTSADRANPQPQIPEYDLLRCVGRGAYGHHLS
jgi:hypothetical protein